MANQHFNTPFQWLQHLEQQAKQKAKGLPRQEKVQHIWRGIAFRLADTLLVTPLHDIREILHCPMSLARVPGAKAWIKGLANIRGLLLPVIDLQACLTTKPLVIEHHTRLLIINQAGIHAGLLVDEVLGIKHFPEQIRDIESPCPQTWLVPFARGLFHYEQATWTVFDMHALAENDIFLKAAL